MPIDSNSELFTVRIWAEQATAAATGLRVRVLHAATGEVRHFHDWAALTAFLQEAMCHADTTQTAPRTLANETVAQPDAAPAETPPPPRARP